MSDAAPDLTELRERRPWNVSMPDWRWLIAQAEAVERVRALCDEALRGDAIVINANDGVFYGIEAWRLVAALEVPE